MDHRRFLGIIRGPPVSLGALGGYSGGPIGYLWGPMGVVRGSLGVLGDPQGPLDIRELHCLFQWT